MAGILHAINAPIGGAGGLVYAINAANINVRAELLKNGWDGVSVVHPTVLVLGTAIIYSTSTGIPSFDTGVLPAGSTVTLVNDGVIVGRGGNGGAYGRPNGNPGGAGGTALRIQVPTTVTNNSIIGGGGGGGGAGAYGVDNGSNNNDGGGGGGGICLGSGGYSFQGYSGGTATFTAAGGGGAVYGNSGAGGNGGFYGATGGSGTSGYDAVHAKTNSGGAGGAAGLAVSGDSLVTWVVLGTIHGARTG